MFSSIDHSLLSPNGRMSRRSRDAAMKREAARLFPPGFFDPPNKTPEEIKNDKIERCLRHAKMLRDLANRGMNTRKFTREAEKSEKEAELLKNSA